MVQGGGGAGRMVWRAMFLSSCVPPDNETELNDISIFSVCVLSVFPPLLKKKKKKSQQHGRPLQKPVIQRFPLGLGDKVVVVTVPGRSELRFHGSPI